MVNLNKTSCPALERPKQEDHKFESSQGKRKDLMERRIRWRRGREQEGRNEHQKDCLVLWMNRQNSLLLRAAGGTSLIKGAHLGSLPKQASFLFLRVSPDPRTSPCP